MSRPSKTHRAAELLAANVEKLINGAEYRAALSFRHQLHRYSFRNVWLIYCQNPDASMVAGYRKWQELGRQVRKGEKSLAIFAPMTRKDKETGELEVFGFRSASVFDVSQTEGEPVPEFPAPELLTAARPADHKRMVSAVSIFAALQGFTVSFEPVEGSALGVCHLTEKTIKVSDTLPPLQTFKTLLHEVAHAVIHVGKTKDAYHLCELEAESVAYLVCDALSLDTSAYSFPYLAQWAEDPQELLGAAQRACKVADTILEGCQAQPLTFASEKAARLYQNIVQCRPELEALLEFKLRAHERVFMGHVEEAVTELLPQPEGRRLFNRCWRLGAYAESERLAA